MVADAVRQQRGCTLFRAQKWRPECALVILCRLPWNPSDGDLSLSFLTPLKAVLVPWGVPVAIAISSLQTSYSSISMKTRASLQLTPWSSFIFFTYVFVSFVSHVPVIWYGMVCVGSFFSAQLLCFPLTRRRRCGRRTRRLSKAPAMPWDTSAGKSFFLCRTNRIEPSRVMTRVSPSYTHRVQQLHLTGTCED